MNLLSKFFNNTCKPEGFWGKIMVNGMNGGHAALAKWAMDALQMPQEGAILDIGCGGGANIARLLKRCPQANVYGVDYSTVSVEKSSNVNADAIRIGRCEIKEASVAALPFKKGTFNLVTAFETIYFWPDIAHSFAEVRRVMAQAVGGASGCRLHHWRPPGPSSHRRSVDKLRNSWFLFLSSHNCYRQLDRFKK